MKLPVEAIRCKVPLQYGCWGTLGAAAEVELRAAAVDLQSGQLSRMKGPHMTGSATARSLKLALQVLCGTVPVRSSVVLN